MLAVCGTTQSSRSLLPAAESDRVGLTYLAVGVGGFLAGPIMIGLGNYGGVYMIIGGPVIVAMGWAVHPGGYSGR
jgi:hypothetical protein